MRPLPCTVGAEISSCDGIAKRMFRRIQPTEHKFYVYVHSRLSTGEPFYVGKGNGKRVRKRDGRAPRWKNIVQKDGGFHQSLLVKDIDEELSMLAEIEAIDLFRRRGCSLVNVTDGGEGASGRKHTAEMRARLSAERKGKPLSRETRAAALAFHLGSSHSPEHREKIAAANRGKRRTPEQRQRMSERLKGRFVSAETRAKMSAAAKRTRNALGYKHTAEARANMSDAHKGKPSNRRGIRLSEAAKLHLSEMNKGKMQSPETCAKKRVSQLARWARIREQGQRL